MKTNRFGEALMFFLSEFAAADAEMLEDGCMEVYGEDDQGREGSCEVTVSDLAQAAIDEINHLREQLAKANERVAGLQLNVKESKAFIAVARGMFLDLDEMEVNSKEYADLLSDLFMLFCGGDEFHKYVNKFAIEKKVEAFEKAQIPRHAKWGCIGEFKFNIEGANCCPECYHDKKDDCELCEGDTDENGLSDLTATVPWDLCKEIWLRMNKIYAEQLRKGGE